jgi:signal transduction histidine kinase
VATVSHGARLSRLAGGLAHPWISLFVVTRLVATGIAVALLLAHGGGQNDSLLAALALAYGLGSVPLALVRLVRESPIAWSVDVTATLTLILATGNWRTPCYLLFLSSLVLPATSLTLRPALAYGVAASAGYLIVAALSGIDIPQIENSPRLESFVTHLLVPLLMMLALAYASDLLRKLRHEHQRAERLAIAAERQRIGWELHDSAKQRTQVAHLLLSSLVRRLPTEARDVVHQAMTELRKAGVDMETSVDTSNPTFLNGSGLGDALRARARELEATGRGRLEVRGETSLCSPMIAAHAYRIGGEAMANAIRHAHAARIVTELDETPERFVMTVSDDGQGMPKSVRPGASGLRSMHNRAQSLGATLRITSAEASPRPGTRVTLEVPLLGDVPKEAT